MKLVSYIKESHEQLALLMNDTLYGMDILHPELPSTMSMFLNYWEDYFPLAKAVNESITEGKISFNKGIPLESAILISPVPLPAACLSASGNSFETSTVDQYPDFYFTNHHSVQGPGEVNCMPRHLKKLDFEPGIAIVVCAHGRNIHAADADNYIGGFMIRNTINTHSKTIKDLSIVLGPWLITPDELKPFLVPAQEGHTGNNYDLILKCHVNNEQVYEYNMANINWTFAEMLESCSYGADLHPGDIIGCASVRGGCFYNLNESGRNANPNHIDRWLQPGDVVEIESEALGISTIVIVNG